MKQRYRKFCNYIENEPWDEWIIQNDRYLKMFCIAVVIIAGIYFGGFVAIGLMG